MRSFSVALLTTSLLAVQSLAGTVELDIDGTLADPVVDSVVVFAGDTVEVDCWLLGSEQVFAWNLALCDSLGALTHASTEYHSPPQWTNTPPLVVGPCVRLSSANISFLSFENPRNVATMAWVASNPGISVITVDRDYSLWLNPSVVSVDSSKSVVVTVVSTTPTREASWSELKQFFR